MGRRLPPALARLLCLEGADETSYQKAEWHLAETGGLAVSARQIQRGVQPVGQAAQAWQEREVPPQECARAEAPVLYGSAAGTGAPMRKEELDGRQGKQAEGRAQTRQVYLGGVFPQHRGDAEGHPVRDWDSTTSVSRLETIDELGPLWRRAALRRGLGRARKVVLLLDGAVGLEHMGRSCFAGAVQVVDFYHALEHAGAVVATLLDNKEHPAYRRRLRHWAKRRRQDGVERLIPQSRREAEKLGRGAVVEEALGYFVRNGDRMQYGTFRRAGFFIGSGGVEAGCQTVIGARCKQSGMFGSVPGAENILALRCLQASRRLDAFWKFRLNQHAARNDALALAA